MRSLVGPGGPGLGFLPWSISVFFPTCHVSVDFNKTSRKRRKKGTNERRNEPTRPQHVFASLCTATAWRARQLSGARLARTLYQIECQISQIDFQTECHKECSNLVEYLSTKVPDRMSDKMSDRMPDQTPERMPDETSDRMPDRMTHGIIECVRSHVRTYFGWNAR